MNETQRKILIVDDEPDLHSLLRVRLEKEGFLVLDAYQGEEALRLSQTENPDVAIVDVVMPGASGFEICKQLKTQNPRLKVIVYTAKIDGVDAGKAKEVGADLFTVKTNSLVLLLASIRRILSNDSE